MNSAQWCPVCFVAPNKPCKMDRYAKFTTHYRRVQFEHGDWAAEYDRLYRVPPGGIKFDPTPFREARKR